MDKDDLLALTSRVEEEVQLWTDGLARGSVPDYADYKYGVGVIYGLRLTQRICQEALQRLEAGDE